MPAQKRMPRYDVRNDGIGPYAVFYCDKCSREFRSQPDIAGTVTKDIGRRAVGGLLRNIPLVGNAVANQVDQDPRYITSMTPQQVEAAWNQVQDRFNECPTCQLVVCPSCWDPQTGYCSDDSPRRADIAEAEGEQAGRALKGLASAFGLDTAFKNAAEAAKRASAQQPHCSKCGAVGAPGAKFCPECGGAMVQSPVATCPKCGATVGAAKFCPECGAKIEQAAVPATCSKCGAELNGAKFCPECGTRAG